MEKLEFKAVKPKPIETTSTICRIASELYNLIEQIAAETCLSKVKITKAMADYLADKIIIIEEEEE